MTDSTTLLPCPFCGKPAKLDYTYAGEGTEIWQASCDNHDECKMSNLFYSSHWKDDCIGAWNTRAQAPAASTVLVHSAAVEVCPDCDIMGCVHIRERTGAFAPAATQEVVERVARAIMKEQQGNYTDDWQRWIPEAKATLQSMGIKYE